MFSFGFIVHFDPASLFFLQSRYYSRFRPQVALGAWAGRACGAGQPDRTVAVTRRRRDRSPSGASRRPCFELHIGISPPFPRALVIALVGSPPTGTRAEGSKYREPRREIAEESSIRSEIIRRWEATTRQREKTDIGTENETRSEIVNGTGIGITYESMTDPYQIWGNKIGVYESAHASGGVVVVGNNPDHKVEITSGVKSRALATGTARALVRRPLGPADRNK
ncbi:hypothetical protein EVAR_96202_1 [Eumeta japonica]|uniref:Uncharacterized protein n=1 Tax=Eumeta variegata TaxID=151549 RepID=A0A4C1VJ40_EUMVA|nr:hypothetical protein EVAR_96202_1 [Eumeta japonica]